MKFLGSIEVLVWSFVVYIGLLVLLLVLAPFTGGKSLGGICFLGAWMAIHGFVYAMKS